MPTTFPTKTQDFSKIQKNPVTKINIINPRAITNYPMDVTSSPKKKDKIPTPRDVLNDYLESTSVHGLQYFGKIDIIVGRLGKVLWACTILISFVCLSLMVIQFLHRYNENPTNMYIKTFNAPIFQAPFPAVTICPSTPISLERRLTILEHAILPENVTREFASNMLKYGHLITHPFAVEGFKYMDTLKAFLHANKWTVSQFLRILIPCEDIFESCWWSAERIDCTKSIKISHTSYGLCCSFNYRLEDYIGSEKDQSQFNSLRSSDFGRWSGLKLLIKNEMLVLKKEDTHDFMKITNSDGIMVLIHHSMEFPGLNSNMYILQANHELEIAINPNLVYKPGGLHHRNKNNQLVPVCITENQNPLEYFPVYRHANCYANCVIKVMIQTCGCLPFMYDHIAEFYNIQRCEIDHFLCIQENEKVINFVKDIQSENFTCSCGASCNDVAYDCFPNPIPLTSTGSSESVLRETATLRVFMYSNEFQILETLPAADLTYLLASIGGIFSLFLGCSFLSLVEIVHFLYLFCRAIYSRSKVKIQTEQTTNVNFVNARRRVY